MKRTIHIIFFMQVSGLSIAYIKKPALFKKEKDLGGAGIRYPFFVF